MLRNCSIVISVRPILARVDRPKPRKMSPIPQIAKLTTSTATTTNMIVLPSQMEEACSRPRSIAPNRLGSQTCQAVLDRKTVHHRESALAPQHFERSPSVSLPRGYYGPGLRFAALLTAFATEKARLRHGEHAASAHCGQ